MERFVLKIAGLEEFSLPQAFNLEGCTSGG